MKNDTQRAVIYARISSKKEEGTDTSIENQKNKCKQYIDLRDYKLVGIFEERKVSGFTRNRKRYKDMVNFLDEGKADVVVIYKLDRITRNVGDLFFMMFDDKGPFKRNKVKLASVMELLDTNSAIGKLFIIIIGAINQFFRDIVSDTMFDIWGNWKKQGRMHTKAPIGYQIRKGKMIPDSNAERVEQAFFEILEGQSISNIADELEMSWSGAKNMLQNRTYVGEIKDDNNEWVNGKHKSIISRELFDKVQEKIGGNNNE